MTATSDRIGPAPEPTMADHALRALVLAGVALFGLLVALVGSSSSESVSTDIELIGIGEQVPASPTGSFAQDEQPISPVETGTRNPMAQVGDTEPTGSRGFYFGTEGVAECSHDRFGLEVRQNADLLDAIAEATAVDQSRMAQWIDQLTPAYVPGNLRVTRFGWDGRRLKDHQSVLQSGTAVLVDASGAPAVLCRGGSLLAAPQEWNDPTFYGTEWDGFDAGSLLTIETDEATATSMVRVDRETDDPFMRPVGAVRPPLPPAPTAPG